MLASEALLAVRVDALSPRGTHRARAGRMSIRLASVVVLPVILVAGGLALRGAEPVTQASAATGHPTSAPQAAAGMPPGGNSPALPPNHPPIGGAMSPHGSPPPPSVDEAPALAWKMPEGWQEAPNPSTMRLATYHAPGGVEVSVSRAGGATEANIQRWIAQFDGLGHEERAERTVHGLHVVLVDLAGTYLGGGMTPGAPSEPRPDWAMVGAIVETRSSPYFFKMTGPAASVRTARAAFDRLVEAVTPT
jgi:hypothetical protein